MDNNIEPLRICFIMQGGFLWVGGVDYIKNIIIALNSLDAEVRASFEISVLCDENVNKTFLDSILPLLNNLFSKNKDLPPSTIVNRIIWKLQNILYDEDNPRFAEFFDSRKIDFVYPYFSSKSKLAKTKKATWIPDFQHKYLKEFFPEEEIITRDKAFDAVAGSSCNLFLSSKSAKADFEKFYPNAIAKTEILPFYVKMPDEIYKVDSESVQRLYSLPERFFIVSNQFFQHKNHLLVFEALRILKNSNVFPNIVLTGYLYDCRNPEYQNTILQTINKFEIAKQIFLLGLIPKNEQIQLLRRSLAMIQPSLFEGWSSAVEDARALGKILILSNLPVHLEQDPANAIYFNPYSAEELAEQIAKLWASAAVGPDLSREAQAREQSMKNVKDFGLHFLELSRKLSKNNMLES